MKMTPNKIRNKILKDRGLTTVKEPKRKHRVLRPAPMTPVPDSAKTPMMRYLELVHGEPIEIMLMSGSLSHVAKRFDNEVDPSTISKWIKKLKLRYGPDNLPNCNRCRREGPACQSGICYVLMELELHELIPYKKEEMLNEGE